MPTAVLTFLQGTADDFRERERPGVEGAGPAVVRSRLTVALGCRLPGENELSDVLDVIAVWRYRLVVDFTVEVTAQTGHLHKGSTD